MKRLLRWILPSLLTMTLIGCGGPRESMFPPTISVQQLHVQANGQWHMQVRILNNSFGPMDFRRLQLTMHINNKPAAHIDTRFDLDIGALTADITEVDVTPSAKAAAALAAIADEGSAGSLAYSLTGKATAIPEHSDSPREFEVDSHDWLSAVPGVAQTYR
ncbi:MAG TPA: hypothetical protein VFJ15_10595 [Oleiagrimonas sp.]|nr:hypothetical protein [Oleiagrimonas sp.]